MAAPGGSEAAPLSETLREEGYRFDFFQAVRLLHQRAPDRAPVGEDSHPDREAVRFETDVSLRFAPSDITSIDLPEDESEDPARVRVPFFGALSPASFGSLPTCYSELVQERVRYDDTVFHEFVDLFNHRMLSLFFRSWEKHRFPLIWERTDKAGGGLFEHMLFSLFGMNTAGLRDRMPLTDLALLRWAGVLARRPVSESQLEAMTSDLFGVKVEAVPFVPTWHAVEDSELEPLGRGGRLGTDMYLGRSVCVGQFRFRLRVGPLSFEAYREFLPLGAAFRSLGDVVRLAVGTEFDFDIQLILKREETPELRLGLDPEQGNRLGWTSWLRTKPLTYDPDDVIIVGSQAA
ncbi:MAG: hypothetical protein DHS20C21_02300 [Gemmatimonadota bacterium]|nr:MAG: hypothetical protein DHS20C21_02300 [Gemmatimonadota bacterium]